MYSRKNSVLKSVNAGVTDKLQSLTELSDLPIYQNWVLDAGFFGRTKIFLSK